MTIIEGIDNELIVVFSVLVGLTTVALFWTFKAFLNPTASPISPSSSSSSTTVSSPPIISSSSQSTSLSSSRPPNLHSSDSSSQTSAPPAFDSPPAFDIPPSVEIPLPADIPPESLIELKVRNGEDTKKIKVCKDLSVYGLKQQLFAHEIQAGHKIRLIHAGRLLENPNQLSFYNIVNQSVIMCIINPAGPAEIDPARHSRVRSISSSNISSSSSSSASATSAVNQSFNGAIMSGFGVLIGLCGVILGLLWLVYMKYGDSVFDETGIVLLALLTLAFFFWISSAFQAQSSLSPFQNRANSNNN